MGRLLKAEGVRLIERPQGTPPGAVDLTNGSVAEPLPLTAPAAQAGRAASPRAPQALAPPGWAGAVRPWRRVGGAVLRSARERACAMMQEARRRARELAEQARREGFEAGWQEGYSRGLQAGQEEARGAASALLERLQAVVDEACRMRDETVSRAEKDLVALALAVAEKVVRRQVEQGPEVTLEVLRSVLQSRPFGDGQWRVRVRVNPREWEWLSRNWPSPAAAEWPVQVEWVADPAVEPGGCMVDSDLGTVDARLSTRLAAVRAALEGD